MERQDLQCFVQRIDNEVRDPKVINRSNNANTQPPRFNTSSYVIEQLDIMGEANTDIICHRVFTPLTRNLL